MIWLTLKDMTLEYQEVKTAFLSGNYWLIIPAFIIGIGSHLSRAGGYSLPPRRLSPGVLNTFFAVMVGYLVNYRVPRLRRDRPFAACWLIMRESADKS